MLLVNHASATTLPETVPAFTAFINMKNERLISRWKTRLGKINKLKNYLWIVSMCVLKCFIILQICGIRYQVKIECLNFNLSSY